MFRFSTDVFLIGIYCVPRRLKAAAIAFYIRTWRKLERERSSISRNILRITRFQDTTKFPRDISTLTTAWITDHCIRRRRPPTPASTADSKRRIYYKVLKYSKTYLSAVTMSLSVQSDMIHLSFLHSIANSDRNWSCEM